MRSTEYSISMWCPWVTPPQTIEVVDADGQVSRLLPVADGAWTGAVARPGSETEWLEIRLTDDTGQRDALVVFVPTLVIPGMSLMILVLMAQALITLAWLLLRWPLVWGRSNRRDVDDAPKVSQVVKI